MPSLTSLATPIEARALARVLPWDSAAGRFVPEAAATFDGWSPTLGEYLDDFAATFAVHGDGPLGQRRLEPLTYLAGHVQHDPVSMARIGALLSSIDDLPATSGVQRVTFATTDQAAAGAWMIADMRHRPLPPGADPDRWIDGAARAASNQDQQSGFYVQSSSDIVFSHRVGRELLHDGFHDPASPLPGYTAAQAARVPPHELLHGTQHVLATNDDAVVAAASEAAASIVGHLRTGTTLRSVELPVVGVDAAGLNSQYHRLTAVVSGLARLGGTRLEDTSQVARFEQRLASLQPTELVAALSDDAARTTGVPASAIADATSLGLLQGPEAFQARLAAAGAPAPDLSIEWMFAEARRRAGIPA